MLECQLCGNFVPYYYRNITGPLQHMPIIDRLKNAELQKKDHITANDLNATLIDHQRWSANTVKSMQKNNRMLHHKIKTFLSGSLSTNHSRISQNPGQLSIVLKNLLDVYEEVYFIFQILPISNLTCSASCAIHCLSLLATDSKIFSLSIPC